MLCKLCKTDNDPNDPAAFTVAGSAEEDGVEVSFICCGCGIDQYVVLQPEVFEEVDD